MIRYEVNRPPKNMISVSRNSHMAKFVASNCCATDSKWCRWYGGCSACVAACTAFSCASSPLAMVVLSDTGYLSRLMAFQPLVIVSFVVHDGYLEEVFGQRGRLYLPLQSCRLPRIIAGNCPIFERPGKV